MSKYAFGWNDPRGVGRVNLNNGNSTKLEDIATEVLRDLWMVQFGKRAVPHDVMWRATEKGQADVAQELVNRDLVSQQVDYSVETDKRTHYYVLLNDTYANN